MVWTSFATAATCHSVSADLPEDDRCGNRSRNETDRLSGNVIGDPSEQLGMRIEPTVNEETNGEACQDNGAACLSNHGRSHERAGQQAAH